MKKVRYSPINLHDIFILPYVMHITCFHKYFMINIVLNVHQYQRDGIHSQYFQILDIIDFIKKEFIIFNKKKGQLDIINKNRFSLFR